MDIIKMCHLITSKSTTRLERQSTYKPIPTLVSGLRALDVRYETSKQTAN